MTEYKGQERRKHKRIKKEYILRLQVRPHAKGDWNLAAVLDLGAGGALFYYNKKVKKDALLDFMIDISAEEPPIECTGKVIRADEIQSYMSLIAVHFEDITEEAKQRINQLADESHSKKIRPSEG